LCKHGVQHKEIKENTERKKREFERLKENSKRKER
jgi:hypothetical protein